MPDEQWLHAALRARNVRYSRLLVSIVEADFDVKQLVEMLAPVLVQTIVESSDLVDQLIAALVPTMGVEIAARLMEHMTGEELAAILSRFQPGS
jgi:hypothetical protein